MRSSVTEIIPTNGVLGFLKKLWGKRAQSPLLARPLSSASTERSSVGTSATGASGGSVESPPAVPTEAQSESAAASSGPAGNGGCIELPLQPILNRLPEGLRARVNRAAVPGVQISVPRDTVLPQLARGVVKVSFGELRRWAPPGVFSPATGDDQALVELPLQDLLACVRADLLQRRAAQRRLEVPADIAPVFGPGGQVPVPALTTAPKSLAPEPPPVSAATPPVGQPAAACPQVPSTSSPAVPQAPPPAAPPEGRLVLSLAALCQGWPASVQAQLSPLAPEATLALPLDFVEEGLKRGKLTVTGRQLRTWVEPAPAPVASAALADDLALELPLQMVAPLFLAQRRPGLTQRRITLPENIPGLFSGSASNGHVAAPTQPVPASAPVAPVPSQTGQQRSVGSGLHSRTESPARPALSPAPVASGPVGADFLGQLRQGKFAPAELVQTIAALPGVTGALLALPEGLLVAGRLPVSRDADTVAGFVPQMFARNAHYLKEFGLGEPGQLTIVADGVPLAIFKTPHIYLAVLGRAGQALPERELAAAAEHLGR